MPGSRATISAAQFAQQLKQKYPQFVSVPDGELVAAFVGKNPQYSADYQGELLVSVSFDTSTGSRLPDESNVSAWATPTTSDGATNDARGVKPVVPAESATPTAEPVYLGATVVVTAESIPARLMVGRYEVVDELGRGGMGIVYKAFDPGIGRTVALKLMSEQLARDSEFRDRFLREARGAGSLQHANIVTIHELGEWQGAPFIAMEFLQGSSLEDILRKEQTMSIEKRLDIVAQVCRGLDYAHARGIVHRDIKPANVMVTNEGIAKVVDFGIARLADQKLTSTGNVLGTVSYMSPEQLQGRAVDGRSDVFAVGVVLYEVLTSVLPFAAEDTGAAITNILYRQPPKLSSFLENYPRELDEIIGKALAKDPDNRFQTTRELADRISLVQQELQRSQTAPTVIRNTPLPSSHPSNPAIPSSESASSASTSSAHIPHDVTKSTQFAQEWWRFASGQARRNAVTVACAVALYLIAIPLVSVPVAILAAIVLATQIPGAGKWWKSVSIGMKLAIGVIVTAVASFCFTKLAVGVMWYVGISANRLMAIPVLAVLATIIGANTGLALGWWKSASGRSRAVGAILTAFLVACFAVVAMNWSSTPKSYFARGGDFEQREKSNQEILSAQKAAYESTPLQIWTDSSWTAKSQFYKSRLMWTNKDNGKQLSWAGAKDYCGKLRLGGYPDWRLPSVDELKGLSEGKRAFDESVAIYHTKKGILLSDPSIWSSATGTGFDFGTEDDIGGRALCVRTDNGKPPSQAAVALPNGDGNANPANASSSDQNVQPTSGVTGVWIDSDTGLTWQKEPGSSERTWAQSDSYCHDLKLAGFSDWRLASLNELESVYPHKRELGLSSYVIWSSEHNVDPRKAWYFYFFDGKRYELPVNDTHNGPHALCVRGTFNGHFHSSEAEAEDKQRAESEVSKQQQNSYLSAANGVWADPSGRGLVWTSKDNGKDIKWIDADNWCRASRLSGYSDWRLPTLGELKAIYDGQQNLNNAGGVYHVKKGIQLSAPFVWSSQEDTPLNFLYGVPASTGGSSYNARALCIRRSS
jgi:serine/threonine protein kinase